MSSRDDALAARAARQVQEHAPTWMVFWSLRHRRFEAWECTDLVRCRAVHADSAGELWDLMQQVELDLWRTQLQGDRSPTPRVGRPRRDGLLQELSFIGEPVGHVLADDPARVTRRIVERHPEPETAP
ncbi:hypothetical protein [Streptosporangium sp. NPDC023615]|uniref:hypothetical protein n=1 Tax=Streptosporangium sp. NPDC023615 TaxID=3154794 RepID=UPI003417FC00